MLLIKTFMEGDEEPLGGRSIQGQNLSSSRPTRASSGFSPSQTRGKTEGRMERTDLSSNTEEEKRFRGTDTSTRALQRHRYCETLTISARPQAKERERKRKEAYIRMRRGRRKHRRSTGSAKLRGLRGGWRTPTAVLGERGQLGGERRRRILHTRGGRDLSYRLPQGADALYTGRENASNNACKQMKELRASGLSRQD